MDSSASGNQSEVVTNTPHEKQTPGRPKLFLPPRGAEPVLPVPGGALTNAVVSNAVQAHDLLICSDVARCQPGQPLPQRNPQTTRALVEAGYVHGLFCGTQLMAMVTIGPSIPHGLDTSLFAPAQRPFYMQRLAVHPVLTSGHSMAGFRCVRTAIDVARRSGADTLRAETNAALTDTVALLTRLGLRPCRRQATAGTVSLELTLKAAT